MVFEGSIPTCSCFHSENLFLFSFCCFFVCLLCFVFRNDNFVVHKEQRININSNASKLNCKSKYQTLCTGFRIPTISSEYKTQRFMLLFAFESL